ncbi:MAG: phage major capsid protein [Bradyrhizobium sp.]|uniref:phage major capsid protein n=1 Tax=Bradyrhizobium sp. TaxID=376 RepID=UPI0025BA973E|nr:phage major capsid protein [Bradyrhizobium sp.]MBI5260260.1 phage major capsid protein [Bradyrhizobium sp.]
MSSTDQQLAESIRMMTDQYLGAIDRLDRIETRLNRPGFGRDQVETSEQQAARARFATFLRYGPEGMEPGDRRALVVGDDTKGGYLAPAEFVAEILRGLVQFSPVRAAARVGTTAAGEVLIPKRTGRLTARWVGETETRTSTEPSYGQLRIPVNEAACYVDVSNQMIEDAAVDIAAELALDLAEEFGRLEGAGFVSGDGNKQPLGFMADADVPSVSSGLAANIDPDSLIDALYALAPYYRNRSAWMMNGTTLANVRKFKSGDGQYLWQPSIAAGQPETILGRPVVEAVDMPDIGAGAFPVVIGDFQSGYRIYDRIQLGVTRDPYTIATSGQTRFHARRRVGGGVAKAEAFRKLKCST